MNISRGERIRFYTWIEKLNLELTIHDGLRLPDQRLESRFAHGTVAMLVSIGTPRCAGCQLIDADSKAHTTFRLAQRWGRALAHS